MKLAAILYLLFCCQLGFCATPVASTTFAGGEQGRIVIQVKVNGRGPFSFLFDMGSMNVISRDLASQLGIAVTGQETVHSFGGTVTTGSAVLDSVSVSELTMQKTQAVVIDGGPFVKGGLSGMLGREFLANLVVEVDYEHGTLRFFDPGTFVYQGHGSRIPVKQSASHAITIPAAIFGAHAQLQVDSGSEASLVLFPAFVRAHSLHSDLQATTGYGYGGPTRAMVLRAPALQLGTFEIKSPIVHLSLNAGGIESGDEDGNLGGPLLREFTWVFDIPHSGLYLEPNDWFGKPELSDKSGLVLDTQGSAAHVLFVYPHSPAAKAGIAPGDQLKDAKGNDMTSDQWHDLFDGATGTQLALTVIHESQRRKATLELRPYL